MAEDSLKDSVSSDQSKDKIYTLSFSRSQWMLFWRLLIVGSALSDEILEIVGGHVRNVYPDTALLWNRLADEFSSVIKGQEVMIT